MAFARAAAFRSCFRAARPVASRPQLLQRVARRSYASGGHGSAQSGGDTMWAVSAVAVTVPTCYYLLQHTPDNSHGHDDHADGHGKVHHAEEAAEEPQGEAEESSDGEETDSEKSEASDDEAKGADTPESSDDESKTDDKEDSKQGEATESADQGETKDKPETAGSDAKSSTNSTSPEKSKQGEAAKDTADSKPSKA